MPRTASKAKICFVTIKEEGGSNMADAIQGQVAAQNVPFTVLPDLSKSVVLPAPGSNGHPPTVNNQKPPVEGSKIPALPGQRSEKDVEKIVESLNRLLEVEHAEVRFSTFKDPNTIVIRMIEQSTGNLIREIPSVKMLKIVHSFLQMMGIAVDEKA